MALTTPRPAAEYKCAQAALYAGLEIVWNSQAEQEAAFAAENTIYTPGLAATKITAIHAARALPDGQARYAEAEVLRVTLGEKQVAAIGKWNSLEGYIKRAFTGGYYKPRIEEAGQDYYTKAASQNWEYVEQLMQAGKTFIANHSAVLIADGGMPAGFAATFDAAQGEFETVYNAFMDARQDAQQQTDAKILANNAIYADGKTMMEDGKHIFRNDASVRERFMWEIVLEMISSPGAGGDEVEEGQFGPGEIDNVDVSDVNGGVTKVIVEAFDTSIQVYGSSAPNGGPNGNVLGLGAGQSLTMTPDEFTNATSFMQNGNTYLNVQNTGGTNGWWRITFEK